MIFTSSSNLTRVLMQYSISDYEYIVFLLFRNYFMNILGLLF